jgi:5'-deoxynucleotidase YfbR-like HD superfamily hydrolase
VKFNKRILYLIEQAGILLQTPRSHIRTLGNTFDTIASHSNHVSIITYCLARMEKLSHEQAMKAVIMAAFHDLAEARTLDLDFPSKNYTEANEEKAIKDQFKNIEFGKDLENLLGEYNKRISKISRIVKDADSLAQIYHEWVLSWRGNKLAEKWFRGAFVARVPYFYTKSAKKIALAMKGSNPNEWWWKEFVRKDGRAKKITHIMGKAYKAPKKRKK